MRTKEQVIAEVERLTEIHNTLKSIDETYFKTLISEAKRHELWTEVVSINCNLANIYFNTLERFDLAKNALNSCQKALTKVISDESIARYYLVYVNLYRHEFNLPKAIYYLNKSLEIILNSKTNSRSMLKLEFNCNYILAIIFNQLGELPKVKYYILKAEKIALNLNDSLLYANCLSHKGTYYLRVENYDLAENLLKQAIEKLRQNNHLYALGTAMFKLGNLYYSQEKYHISLNYFIESYELTSNQFPNTKYCSEAMKIALNYLKINKLKEAENFLFMAWEQSKDILNKDIKVQILKGLCEYYAIKEDFKMVLLYRDQIDEIRDEIQVTERAKKVLEIEEKYQSALKQKEINFRKKKQRETERHIDLIEEQNQLTKSMIALLNKGLKNPVRQGKQMLALLNRGGIRQEDKAKIISSIQEYFEQIEQFSKDVKEIIFTDSKEALGEKLDAATIASLVNKNLSGKKDEFDLDRAKYPKTYFIQEHVSRLAKHAEQSNKIMPLIKGRSSGVLI
jgi:tetratricopeptide (TPR) repeat protein